jgi:hypothetical protein
VIRDFDRREQMRPLNHEKDKDGKAKRIVLPEEEVYLDHKGGFEATRSKLESSELGIWARFLVVDGIGGEASFQAKRSQNDTYKFESVDTEYFYPTPSYISQCLALSDVEEYMKSRDYKKPVYFVMGLKVAKGVSVRLEGVSEVELKLELGLNNPGGSNIQAGPRVGGKIENKPVSAFTESSDIVVGIQCLKIAYKTGWFSEARKLTTEVYSGGTFLGDDGKKQNEVQFGSLDAMAPEDYNNCNFAAQRQATEQGKEDEIWMLPVIAE